MQLLKRHDQNGDGLLDPREMASAMNELCGTHGFSARSLGELAPRSSFPEHYYWSKSHRATARAPQQGTHATARQAHVVDRSTLAYMPLHATARQAPRSRPCSTGLLSMPCLLDRSLCLCLTPTLTPPLPSPHQLPPWALTPRWTTRRTGGVQWSSATCTSGPC